jgi:Uma2 family endonuclease
LSRTGKGSVPMRGVPPTARIRFDEFCELSGDGEKADLIDGVISVAPPDSPAVNDLFLWLMTLLDGFVEEHDLGKVFVLRVAFRLDDWNGPEPDIAFVSKHRLHLVERRYVAGPPDLAVEIVSPESVERDYEKKRRQYERAGVPEYWIVDELEQRVTLLRLGARKKYKEVRPRKGELYSEVVPGFRLRAAWLWQNPRPKTLVLLKEIMDRQG